MTTNILLWILLGVGILAITVLVVVLIYTVFILKTFSKITKKIDYLVEDITYKSEMLNSTIETVSKVSNYLNIFDVVTKRKWKSMAKLIARNKNNLYKVSEKIQDLLKNIKKDEKNKK